MNTVLKDAGLRLDRVDLLLNQANWSLLRPPAEDLLESVGKEFARRLKESGWSSEDGYATPLVLWRRLVALHGCFVYHLLGETFVPWGMKVWLEN